EGEASSDFSTNLVTPEPSKPVAKPPAEESRTAPSRLGGRQDSMRSLANGSPTEGGILSPKRISGSEDQMPDASGVLLHELLGHQVQIAVRTGRSFEITVSISRALETHAR
ncbi:unnamed protein product, partial [Polarella glacialis]